MPQTPQVMYPLAVLGFSFSSFFLAHAMPRLNASSAVGAPSRPVGEIETFYYYRIFDVRDFNRLLTAVHDTTDEI